jgi:hypothetical protein
MSDNLEDHSGNAELCLTTGYGICGHHAIVFSSLLKQIGIQTRPVQFFYYLKDGRRLSHIAIEAFIGSKWRFFDSTWGGFFRDKSGKSLAIASIEYVIALPDAYELIENAAQTWTFQYSRFYDVYEYINPNTSVIYGNDDGTIYIRDIDESKGEIYLQHIPSYVGDPTNNGNFKGVKYKFPTIEGRYTFHLDISGIQGCNDKQSKLCINDNCVAVEKIRINESTNINIINPNTIQILTEGNVCAVTFNKIFFTELKR